MATTNEKTESRILSGRIPDLVGLSDPAPNPWETETVLLKIKESQLVTDMNYVWEYTVELAGIKESDKSADVIPFNDSSVDPTIANAFNGWEIGNTSTSVKVLGPGNPADLPDGWDVEALPDDLLVWGTLQRFFDTDADSDSYIYFFICQPNPISGACA